MRFTPAQALALADIPAETLRYWKKFLLPLAAKRGHAPCYTRAEILGLIVVRRLVRDFKMDVSVLQSQADQLFAVCASVPWTQPGRRHLVVTCEGSVSAHEDLTRKQFLEPVIVFPLDIAVNELEQRWNERERPSQLELGLPPVSIKASLGSGR